MTRIGGIFLGLTLACSAQVEHDEPAPTCEQQHTACVEAYETAASQASCEAPFRACAAARMTTTRLNVHECVRVIRYDEAVPFEVNGKAFTASNCLAFVVVDDAGAEMVTRGAFVWVLPPGEAGVCTCD